MCFAKNLLEGKTSAGSSKKAPVNRHGSSVRGTAIHQLQDEDVVAPPNAFISSKGMQSRKDSQQKRLPTSFVQMLCCKIINAGTGRSRSSVHRIVGHAVVPQNLALVFLDQRQSEEMIDSFGISRIDVRIVRGKNQIAAAELLDDVVGDDFVGLDGHAALPFEIITGLLL